MYEAHQSLKITMKIKLIKKCFISAVDSAQLADAREQRIAEEGPSTIKTNLPGEANKGTDTKNQRHSNRKEFKNSKLLGPLQLFSLHAGYCVVACIKNHNLLTLVAFMRHN